MPPERDEKQRLIEANRIGQIGLQGQPLGHQQKPEQRRTERLEPFVKPCSRRFTAFRGQPIGPIGQIDPADRRTPHQIGTVPEPPHG